ncbi:MAG: hypothetical protein KAI16_01475 [Candidatus Pacebacteria bacterium]|nr:hypothetical protein [Candidatus Paceibacterota bacterium]
MENQLKKVKEEFNIRANPEKFLKELIGVEKTMMNVDDAIIEAYVAKSSEVGVWFTTKNEGGTKRINRWNISKETESTGSVQDCGNGLKNDTENHLLGLAEKADAKKILETQKKRAGLKINI